MSPHLPSVGTRPRALDTRALVTMPPHLPGQPTWTKPSNVAAARVPDPRVAGLPEPSAAKEEQHATKASQQAPVVHGDVSVAITESSDLIAAALEDMRLQGSKAKFLLPSLLCSAVSSGA